MPKIFSKDCKIKVIEYGSPAASSVSWRDIKDHVQSLIPASDLFKFVKRAS